MSIKLKTPPDYAKLPTAMLADAKAHLRVDWAYDDALIKSMISRALCHFEDRNGVALNEAVYTWTPDQLKFADNRTPVPVTPVTAFTAKLPDATDVSSSYTITTDTVFGVPLLYLNGAWQSGVTLDLAVGFVTLPPSVLSRVLELTAHLYEHREILIPGTEFVAPDFAADATWWVPRA